MFTPFFIWKGYVLSGEIALKNNHYYYYYIYLTPLAFTPLSKQLASIWATAEDQMEWRFFLQRWQGIGLDATCTDSFSTSNLCSTNLNPGSTSSAAEDSKRRKYYHLVADFRVCSSGCWNIGSAVCPRFNWYWPPHFESHQWSPPDVLHLSTDFSCHHPRQRTDYNSLIMGICPGVGWEILTFKMEIFETGVLFIVGFTRNLNIVINCRLKIPILKLINGIVKVPTGFVCKAFTETLHFQRLL